PVVTITPVAQPAANTDAINGVVEIEDEEVAQAATVSEEAAVSEQEEAAEAGNEENAAVNNETLKEGSVDINENAVPLATGTHTVKVYSFWWILLILAIIVAHELYRKYAKKDDEEA
ncbi:MAG: hypothetical protein K6A92_07355, partial [Lachnospiraceae bacterium]|nr:hypothetical protein [Lachnospiraceae bacterium]